MKKEPNQMPVPMSGLRPVIGAHHQVAAIAQGCWQIFDVSLQPADFRLAAADAGGDLQHALRVISAGFGAEAPTVFFEKRADAATEVEDSGFAIEQAVLLQPAGDDPRRSRAKISQTSWA